MRETNGSVNTRSMRLSRRRALGLAAIGAGSSALLAACGAKNRSASSAPAAGRAGNPRPGGQVAVRVNVDPFDWDLSRTGRSVPNSQAMAWTYNSLMGFKYGPGVKFADLIIRPELANKYEVPDSQTYSFHLRPGVKFANLAPVNGRELTSADVRWSYEYWSRTGQFGDKKLPPGQFTFLFDGIDRIDTPDPFTAVVHFKVPFAPFLTNAASDYNPVVPHEIFDQDNTLSNRVVGTGAWQLDTSASQKGNSWIFTKNPTYWDSGKPYLDRLTLLVLPDASSASAAFISKQLDIFDPQDQATVTNISKTFPAAILNQDVHPLCDHLHMNVRIPPLNDIRIRQAIAYALNRDEYIKVQTGGKGAWGMAGAMYGTFGQEEMKQLLKYDPAAARQFVAAAGHPNGLDIEMTFSSGQGDFTIAEHQIFQAQMKQAGINIILKDLDKADYSSRRKKGDFIINLLATQPANEDIGSLAFGIFSPGNQANYGGVDDPPLTALLQAQQGEVDPAKRKDLIRQAVRRVNSEMFWALSPMHRVNYQFWQPNLQNFAPNFGNQGWPLFDSWLAK